MQHDTYTSKIINKTIHTRIEDKLSPKKCFHKIVLDQHRIVIEEKERQGIERRKPDNQPSQTRRNARELSPQIRYANSLRVNNEIALPAILRTIAKHHPIQIAQPLEPLAARHPLH
jgi:hypothetical protein